MTIWRGSNINVSWVLSLRWGAIVGQLAAALGAYFLLSMPLQIVGILVIIALEALSNIALTHWFKRPARRTQEALTALMALDFLFLTALLYLAGGPYNPFSFVYLVNLALAAVTLPARPTWGLVVLSLACFGSLFFLSPGDPQHDHAAMQLHTQGMWVAMAVAAAFIVHFVRRVVRALEEREHQVQQAREQAARSERLLTLTSLATGAAHELATPLSTIAVVAHELEHKLAQDSPDTAADAHLIRQEVDRCSRILHDLSAAAGQNVGEATRPRTPQAICTETLHDLPAGHGVIPEVDPALPPCELPAQGLPRVLRALVRNALRAAPSGAISLRARVQGADLVFQVVDDGPGMVPEVRSRATDPFFTTKAPGLGLGLGLYLAEQFALQWDGRLEIDSAPGRGTTVSLYLPFRPAEARVPASRQEAQAS